MKRAIFVLAVSLVVLTSGCQKKAGVKDQGLVSQESYTVPFTGYKVTVKVKATPAEVEKYLLDIKNLELSTKTYSMKVTGNSVLSKEGDIVEAKTEFMGIPISGKVLLVHYKPGAELWMVMGGKYGGTGILRYNLKEVSDGTRVNMRFEYGELENLLSAIPMEDQIMKSLSEVVENTVANLQVRFDPSLNKSELMEQGLRGDNSENFYNGQRASIWINASPAAVDKALKKPALWDELNKKGIVDMGYCVITTKSEPCPIRLKILGLDYVINSFLVSYKPGEHYISYWVTDELIGHIQLLLKPERGGTRLTYIYVVEVPSAMTAQGTDFLMNASNYPKYIERVLTEIKNSVEGIG